MKFSIPKDLHEALGTNDDSTKKNILFMKDLKFYILI